MKKIVVTGLLAISMLALTQQQASAWINAKFGVGLNLGWQSGGNQVLWGAWSNGQVPGPEAFGVPQVFAAPLLQPYVPSPYDFPPLPQHHHHHGSLGWPSTTPAFAGQYAVPYAQPMMQFPPPYQFATYPRPVYYYYGR